MYAAHAHFHNQTHSTGGKTAALGTEYVLKKRVKHVHVICIKEISGHVYNAACVHTGRSQKIDKASQTADAICPESNRLLIAEQLY